MLERMSIRSIQRVTGALQETILNLLMLPGEKCEQIMNRKIKNIPVRDVEADEIWRFVKMRRPTKLTNEIDSFCW